MNRLNLAFYILCGANKNSASKNAKNFDKFGVVRHGSCYRLVLPVRLRLLVAPNVLNIRLRHTLCATIVCWAYGYLIFFL